MKTQKVQEVGAASRQKMTFTSVFVRKAVNCKEINDRVQVVEKNIGLRVESGIAEMSAGKASCGSYFV